MLIGLNNNRQPSAAPSSHYCGSGSSISEESERPRSGFCLHHDVTDRGQVPNLQNGEQRIPTSQGFWKDTINVNCKINPRSIFWRPVRCSVEGHESRDQAIPISEHITFLQTGTKFNLQGSETHMFKQGSMAKISYLFLTFYFKRTQEFRRKNYRKQQTSRIPLPKFNRYFHLTLVISDSLFLFLIKQT